MALLLREAIGGSLRRARTLRKRTLRDVSRAARVSLGYLSEVERGRKEPSSELLAAICEALDVSLPDLLAEVIGEMTATERELEFVGRTDTLVPIGQRHADLRLAPVRAPMGARPGTPVASAA
ncbi:helix-turn-helix domain-containing protein [Pseudonocardia pini]|jgi:transcriptional regulator with XRE-family HTH domain|uniref:helix-turn-helix domain-containing protein n=1 Tax=Pseudonocardia pini TaxID=2758030 RepID=UPI0015F08E92|nr:helix-turn-helix transcriptional regulator [Pseudonocardia pini]